MRSARRAPEAGAVANWLQVAGNSAYYETNPIVRQAGREAGLPPKFHGLALPLDGKTGTGAGLRGDMESSRSGDHSTGGVVEE